MISYTLYPEVMADIMAAEVLRALTWTLANARRYGGDPSRLAVAGHSAGGHLGALAVIMLARLRQEELEQQQRARAEGRGNDAAAGEGAGGRGAAAWRLGPVLGLPRVQLFVGMSGVSHVARHHEYEASRWGPWRGWECVLVTLQGRLSMCARCMAEADDRPVRSRKCSTRAC